MFTSFSFGGLTISNLQAQVVGLLTNPFLVSMLLAALALVMARRIMSAMLRIMGLGSRPRGSGQPEKWTFQRVLRHVRWYATGTPARMMAYGEDPGDVEFWYDQEVRQGHSRPVGFRRTANYRLQKHRKRARA